jgi:hypothetical protein
MTCPAPAGLLISADADGGRPGSGDARGEDEHERGDESAVLLVDLMAHVRAGDVRHGRGPMHLIHLMQQAPRCHAHSKRTGAACRAPAVRGWKVCRMHGARGGGPIDNRNGNYRTGRYTRETLDAVALIKAVARLVRRLD